MVALWITSEMRTPSKMLPEDLSTGVTSASSEKPLRHTLGGKESTGLDTKTRWAFREEKGHDDGNTDAF